MLTICDIEDESTWHLIRYTHPRVTEPDFWWARKGTNRGRPVWVNRNGGWYPRGENAVSVKTTQAEGYWELPEEDTTKYRNLLNVPDSCRLGWLSPEGKFYPCGYADHDEYAYMIIGQPVKMLEAEGWCRITGSNDRPSIMWGRGREATEAQAEFLLDNNYI